MKAIITFLLILTSHNLFGQKNEKVNQVELIQELQIWDKNNGNMKLAFWIPNCYWRIALEDNPKITEDVIKKLEMIFQDYIVLCLADVEIKTGGAFNYTSKLDLKKTATIIDQNNKTHLPLDEKDISIETNTIIDNMRPMFAQMFGKLGEGMHFFLFKAKNKKGENIINELEENNFTVKHSSHEFKWNLPLSSLLPRKHCPIDSKEMSGGWNFCPLHGNKLIK